VPSKVIEPPWPKLASTSPVAGSSAVMVLPVL
jgi:hypothetical protein